MVFLEVPFPDDRRLPQEAPVFGEVGSHWGVIEASAVPLPSIEMEAGDRSRYRRVPRQQEWERGDGCRRTGKRSHARSFS